MSAEENLKRRNIVLPNPPAPVANYVRAVRTGNLLYTAGAGPSPTGPKGKVGRDLTSDLMVEVFGEEIGKHARSAVGMAALPNRIPVEIEMIVECSARSGEDR